MAERAAAIAGAFLACAVAVLGDPHPSRGPSARSQAGDGRRLLPVRRGPVSISPGGTGTIAFIDQTGAQNSDSALWFGKIVAPD